MIKKVNVSLVWLNLVLFFVLVCGIISASQAGSEDMGYASRIDTLEVKVTKLISDVQHLQMNVSTVTSSPVSAVSSGQWQNLGGGKAFEPKPGDKMSVSSTTHKGHFWEGCQYFNPLSKMTYAEAQAKFIDLELCLLCVKHLVPPGGGVNLAPANNANKTTQGAIKK